jgi:hypothetical protein
MLYLHKQRVGVEKPGIIDSMMKTKHFNPVDGNLYTEKQLLKFRFFCYKKELTFQTLAEYNGALAQFFSE